MNSTETSRLQKGLQAASAATRVEGLPGSMACTPGPQHHGVFPRTHPSLENSALGGRGCKALPCCAAGRSASRRPALATGTQGTGSWQGRAWQKAQSQRCSHQGSAQGSSACWPAHTALTGSAAPELQGRKVQNKYGVCDRHRENNIKQGNPSSSKHYSRWQKQRE